MLTLEYTFGKIATVVSLHAWIGKGNEGNTNTVISYIEVYVNKNETAFILATPTYPVDSDILNHTLPPPLIRIT